MVQGDYILRLSDFTIKYNMLHRLQFLEEIYTNLHPPQEIREYEEIYNLLMKSRREYNSRVHIIHMYNVHSYQNIKMSQLHLYLSD